MRMFRNDYSEGAAPEVLAALVATNDEQCVGYTEGDPHCERARELIRAACGRDDIAVEFAIGGTSANLVCVNGFLKDWEGVICTPDAHINVHETGAVGATGLSGDMMETTAFQIAQRRIGGLVVEVASDDDSGTVWQQSDSTHQTVSHRLPIGPRLSFAAKATGGMDDEDVQRIVIQGLSLHIQDVSRRTHAFHRPDFQAVVAEGTEGLGLVQQAHINAADVR